MTQEELEGLARKWQEILRLRDWEIYVALTRARDFEEEGQAGEADIRLPHRIAKIYILDPVDHSPTYWRPLDLEEVLVHELLHLHLEPLWPKDRDTGCHVAEEQAVNALARALIALDRKNADGPAALVHEDRPGDPA